MKFQVSATVSLNIQGDRLVYAGLGDQPSADFRRGQKLGEVVFPVESDSYLEVKTAKGNFLVRHENVQEIYD
jgi:hypothetical protein